MYTCANYIFRQLTHILYILHACIIHLRMDARMDGWTDGRMDRWTDGRMDGHMVIGTLLVVGYTTFVMKHGF